MLWQVKGDDYSTKAETIQTSVRAYRFFTINKQNKTCVKDNINFKWVYITVALFG